MGREEALLVHVAGYNLGLIMHLLVGVGIPRKFLASGVAYLLAFPPADDAALVLLVITTGSETAMLAVSLAPEPSD